MLNEKYNVSPLNLYKESGKYVYKPISVPGGGFVTGFVFHPTVPNILYCRTDIGGNYRYDCFFKGLWCPLCVL